jgi:hypothetical protein
MDIRNVTQFYNFITQNDMVNLHSALQQISDCIHNYQLACSCYDGTVRNKTYQDCNRKYIDAVRSAVPSLSAQFLSKTGNNTIEFFWDETNYIRSIRR